MRFCGFRYLGVMCIVLAGCGGTDGTVEPAIRYAVEYKPQPSIVFPNGTVIVGPVAPDRSIGTATISSVELTLYGQAAQVLRQPNFERKEDGVPRYVFSVPAAFSVGAFECDGKHPSYVLVRDVNGYAIGKSFNLCPGSESEISTD